MQLNLLQNTEAAHEAFELILRGIRTDFKQRRRKRRGGGGRGGVGGRKKKLKEAVPFQIANTTELTTDTIILFLMLGFCLFFHCSLSFLF